MTAWTSSGQYVVFSDNFTGDNYFTNTSTINSTTPGFAVMFETNSIVDDSDTNSDNGSADDSFADTINTTSYEIVSSGVWNTNPSISSGNLDFGLAASGSPQNIEVQALFADDVNDGPIQLGATNDSIQLTVIFTDKNGVLTNSAGGGGYFCMGLYYSGSEFDYNITNDNLDFSATNLPITGGMNGTAVSTSSTHATGSAQNWVGYSAQIANTGVTSRINTRFEQTGSGNNNQDVLLGGDLNSNKGYANPGPHIFHSPNSTVVLANGNQYTAVLTLTATEVDTNNDGLACAISNSVSLYAGAGTSGTLLMQYGINLTGTNFTTNLFDGFAIGWYENQTNAASEISISEITVTACPQRDIANSDLGDVALVDSNTVPVLGVSNAVYSVVDSDNIVLEDLTDGTGTNTVEMVVAGNGIAGYFGDGGQATNAELNSPAGVAVDVSGNVYIADTSNNVVRMVTPSGIISTVAGSGIAGYFGDGGSATSAELNGPSGVAVDTNGDLYIADSGNNRIREVTPAFHYISTVAGNGMAGYSGDWGLATNASLNYPIGVSVDNSGDFYISDNGNNVIRQVNPNGYIMTAVTTAVDPSDAADDPHTMVAAATNMDGRLEVFAVAIDQQLYHNYETAANGNAWSGWIPFGSSTNFSLEATPAPCLDTAGSLIVFIVGNDGQMYRFKELTAGNSTSWDNGYCLKGNFSPDARVAASSANGPVWGFAVSQTNNQLQSICQTNAGGSWGSWTNMGGTWDPQSDVAVGQNPDGSLSLLMIGVGGVNDTNVLYEKRQQGPNGAWTSWTSRGGTFSYISFIGLVNYGAGTNANLQAFIVDNNPNGTHELMQSWKTNSGAGWIPGWFTLGTNTWRTTYQVPVAIRNLNGQVGVFMAGWDGNIYYNYCDPFAGWQGWTTGTSGLGNIGQPSDASFEQGIGVSAGMNLNGDFDVFGVGDDGSLYKSIQASPGGGFTSGWTNFTDIPNGASFQ